MKLFAAILLLAATFLFGAATDPWLSPSLASLDGVVLTPEIQIESGDFRFVIYYTSKGTRSEGVHGLIFEDNQEIIGEEIGQKLETPIGTYFWRGSITTRKELWDQSGWLPTNLDRFYPSWSKNAAEQGAAVNP